MAILSQDPRLDVRIKAVIETRAVLAAELDDAVRYRSHRVVTLYDVDTGSPTAQCEGVGIQKFEFEQATGREVATFALIDGLRIEFGVPGSSSQELVLLNRGIEPVVELVRLTDGEVLAGYEDPRVEFPFWPRFSPDGRTMVVGSQQGIFTVGRIDELLAGASVEESTTRIQAALGPANNGSAGTRSSCGSNCRSTRTTWPSRRSRQTIGTSTSRMEAKPRSSDGSRSTPRSSLQ